MALDITPESRPGFKQQIENAVRKYGFLALILFLFGFWISYLMWNMENSLRRVEQQMETNFRIGKLEGKMELLEEMNILTTPTPTPTSIPNSP